MQDLKLAKRILKEKALTLVVVRKGEIIFEAKSHGINDFLQAIEKFKKELAGSAVADRIVGRAAALLCAYSKVASVFAVTISEEGRKVLEDWNIFCEFENSVAHILNYQKTGVCPFEKIAASLTDPNEAYEKLKTHTFSNILREKENVRV